MTEEEEEDNENTATNTYEHPEILEGDGLEMVVPHNFINPLNKNDTSKRVQNNALFMQEAPPQPVKRPGFKKRTKSSPTQAEQLRKKRTKSMEARRARKGNVSLKVAYRNPLKNRGRKKVQVDNNDIEILADGNGRKYSFNNTTDEAKWLDEESADETQTEETEWLGVYPEENKTTDTVFTNENIDDVDVVKLETLEDDNGRRYSWNPTTDETSWIDAENDDEIIEMTMKQ